MSRRDELNIPADLLGQLLASTVAAKALEESELWDRPKALAGRVLGADMEYHLGHVDQAGTGLDGYCRRIVTTETGQIPIYFTRGHSGGFDPKLIVKTRAGIPVSMTRSYRCTRTA